MGIIRAHRAHLTELRQMENNKELRRSRYFVMTKEVHRRKDRGRGSKFQNYKVTSYNITSAMSVFNSAWSPNDNEISKLIHADFERDVGVSRRRWKFYDKHKADKAWVLLMLKYGE